MVLQAWVIAFGWNHNIIRFAGVAIVIMMPTTSRYVISNLDDLSPTVAKVKLTCRPGHILLVQDCSSGWHCRHDKTYCEYHEMQTNEFSHDWRQTPEQKPGRLFCSGFGCQALVKILMGICFFGALMQLYGYRPGAIFFLRLALSASGFWNAGQCDNHYPQLRFEALSKRKPSSSFYRYFVCLHILLAAATPAG